MELREAAALLWLVARGDQYPRDTSEPAIAYWHELVGDLDYADAVEAVKWHRQNSTEYLQPAHIRRRALVARGLRKRQAQRALDGPAVFRRPPELQAYVERKAAETRSYLQSLAPPELTQIPDEESGGTPVSGRTEEKP